MTFLKKYLNPPPSMDVSGVGGGGVYQYLTGTLWENCKKYCTFYVQAVICGFIVSWPWIQK